MKLIKTYYLNCSSNEIATRQNDTIRFDGFTLWSHCTFMSAMCYSFWKTQLLQQEGLKEPRKLCILVDEDILFQKRKIQNKSTGFEQLDWFINNMEPTVNGLIITVYTTKVFKTIEDRWSPSTIWPLKKEWEWQGGGNYFTLQDTESNASFDKYSSKQFHKTKEIILEIDKYSALPVKRINYSMSEKEMFDLLKYSNLHFSYNGGTYYSAGMIGCPTVGLYNIDSSKKSLQYYENKPTVIGKIKQPEYKTSMIDSTWWNLGVCNLESRILQYDYNTVYQSPQTYLKHVTKIPELLSYLKLASDFVVNGKRYEIS